MIRRANIPLALAMCALFACGSPSAILIDEAKGISWEGLTGVLAYSRWQHLDHRSYMFLLITERRSVELIRDEPATITGWTRDVAFRTDGSSLTYSLLGGNGLWELHNRVLDGGTDTVLDPDPGRITTSLHGRPRGTSPTTSTGPPAHSSAPGGRRSPSRRTLAGSPG